MCCFVFKQKTAYEMRISDWSSDVRSSDLAVKTELMEELEQLPIDECRDAVAQLTAAEREFQQYGFCTSLSAWRMGVNAVGCPTWDDRTSGERYVVSSGGTDPEYTAEAIFNDIGPHLKEFARFLMPKLGGQTDGRAHVELQSLMRISYAVFCLNKKKYKRM